ncbi:alpha-amylase [Coprinopsis cinerea okayama7|uniref:Alpha-amylase n=1 Tax=Coprinopsis cinerea (strain Okayama-7 / 130 / ATCC MYA-4618 / FGSC 9003) TaxID=240176 RepID=A8NG05_COPC7|nr:alpha-amylase [Coprinopsis cinerea okayama7\|eukprot:XP_001833444.2 alpha-amylase [Coprinopsis cinerea okayama7\
MLSFTNLYFLIAFATLGYAATADEWRSRSIYQLLTDRFALPPGTEPIECDTGRQTFCGGTWNGIRDRLDYIQNAGFTAIWISPVHKNYEGPRTPYGDPYHGYWVTDITQLNSKFGTSEDLHALVDDLHKRGMYLMVDIVVNHVMTTSTTPDYENSEFFFKDASFYHPYCPIDYSNSTSEQVCWMGDEQVPLADVDTTNPTVIQRYGEWIEAFVKEYKIDGLRIDAAKHVQADFWPDFCGKAGVFCMGEVFGGAEVDPVAQWQGPLDSVLNFPMYSAIRDAYVIPGPANVTGLDLTLVGNFLENHDVPRWHNLSVDPQSLYNAMAWNFMTEGIPVVYYGQEHGFSGLGDPHNREALWPSGYANSTAYEYITMLNMLRNHLIKTTDWLQQETTILTSGPHGVAFIKGSVISILTTIGSPPQVGTHISAKTPYASQTPLTNVVTCQQWVVGAGGSVDAQYSLGGVPVILVPSSQLKGSGLCGEELVEIDEAGGRADPLKGSASGLLASRPGLPVTALTAFTFLFAMLSS